LRLGPLSTAAPGGEIPTAVTQSVLTALLPNLRKLALPGLGDVAQVQAASLRVLGQLALSDAPEANQAAGVLREVIESNAAPHVLLLAASLYSTVPSSHRGSQPVFDRLLAHSDRWVRLQTLTMVGDAAARSLLSSGALAKAAQDNDGFVREAAQRLK